MTIKIYKKHIDVSLTASVSDSDDGAEVYYFAHTDANETDADVHAFAVLPANIPHDYRGLGITKIRIERLEEDDSIWSLTANYASRSASQTQPKLDVGEFSWRIRTTNAGSQKQTQSTALVAEVTAAANFAYTGTPLEKALGITGTEKGGYEIEGVDKPTGSIVIDTTSVVSAADITAGYLVTIAAHAAQFSVNSLAWEGWAAETLRIMSYAAKPRSADSGAAPDWDISLSFEFSPNLTGLVVGGLAPIDKKGHDYLDVLYARAVVSGLTVSKPVRAATHQRFPKINYATVLKLT